MHIAQLVGLSFTIYELLILIRILSSWFGEFEEHPLIRQIATLTDPYLSAFRRIIPPIGGTLDLSPTLALLALGFARRQVLRFFLW